MTKLPRLTVTDASFLILWVSRNSDPAIYRHLDGDPRLNVYPLIIFEDCSGGLGELGSLLTKGRHRFNLGNRSTTGSGL